MNKFWKVCKENVSFLLLSAFYLFALINPVFKKFDYGGGFPLVMLFAVILGVITFFEFRKKRERVYLEPLFLMIFCGGVILSFIYSETRNVGFSEVLAFLSVILLYILFAYQKLKWRRPFLKVVAIGGVLAIATGYILYLFKPETRMFGPFFNILDHANEWPNAFTHYLLIVWPIFLLLFKKKWDYWRAIFLGIILSALLFTFSRGGMIVLSGQLILILIYFVRRISIKNLLLVLLTFVVGFGLFFSLNYLKSLNYEVIDADDRLTLSETELITSKQERFDFWEGTLNLTRTHPWLGWGPFSFRYSYSTMQKTFLGNADHPHNLFLKLAAEYGHITLAGFVLFLLTVFLTIIKRFKKLNKKKKDNLYLMGVAIAGSFAHNLIDYNWNFIVNLMLVFIILAFMRSMVVKKPYSKGKSYFSLIFGVLIAIVAIWEGGILFLDSIDDDSKALKYSFYPRNFYLNEADDHIIKGEFDLAIADLDKHLDLNSLDAVAYHRKGAVYFHEENPNRDLEISRENFQIAIQKDPLSGFLYYRCYLQALIADEKGLEIITFIDGIMPLIEDYFVLVDQNLHYTAYTDNVEVAAQIIDLLIPFFNASDAKYLREKKIEMLEKAEHLRNNKAF